MAKVNVEFDTKTKELSVSLDGKSVPNVNGISLSKSYYSDEEEFSMCLMTLDRTKSESDGYSSMTQICAKQAKEAKEMLQQGAGTYEPHPDFLLLKKITNKLSASLSDYMKSHRSK